jgi:hypothetical protein
MAYGYINTLGLVDPPAHNTISTEHQQELEFATIPVPPKPREHFKATSHVDANHSLIDRPAHHI